MAAVSAALLSASYVVFMSPLCLFPRPAPHQKAGTKTIMSLASQHLTVPARSSRMARLGQAAARPRPVPPENRPKRLGAARPDFSCGGFRARWWLPACLYIRTHQTASRSWRDMSSPIRRAQTGLGAISARQLPPFHAGGNRIDRPRAIRSSPSAQKLRSRIELRCAGPWSRTYG